MSFKTRCTTLTGQNVYNPCQCEQHSNRENRNLSLFLAPIEIGKATIRVIVQSGEAVEIIPPPEGFVAKEWQHRKQRKTQNPTCMWCSSMVNDRFNRWRHFHIAAECRPLWVYHCGFVLRHPRHWDPHCKADNFPLL